MLGANVLGREEGEVHCPGTDGSTETTVRHPENGTTNLAAMQVVMQSRRSVDGKALKAIGEKLPESVKHKGGIPITVPGWKKTRHGWEKVDE